MEQTTTPRIGPLPITEAAVEVGVAPVELRQAVAAGDLPHRTRIVVDLDDVREWAADRDAS